MAIDMKRYIDIKSGVATSTLGERNLQGLVFTTDEMVAGATASILEKYVQGIPVKMTQNDISKCFGATSDTVKFAAKYFSYVGPGSSAPSILSVVKVLDTTGASAFDSGTDYAVGDIVSSGSETTIYHVCIKAIENATSIDAEHFVQIATDASPADAFARVDELTNDFGSFAFIDPETPYTAAQIEAVAQANVGKDFKYLFCQGFTTSDTRKTAFLGSGTGALVGIAGTHIVQGADKYAAAMPMAMTASVNYDRSGAAICMMFKQFSNEVATVTDDTTADDLDAVRCNYYGQTQTNGQNLSFYQRGFNADGLDTMVYFNELWLKSRIATDFMNLATSVGRIPADDVGMGLVRSVVAKAVNHAMNNGTITIKQSLTTAQEAQILTLSGNDADAPSEVLNNGYWLDVVVSTTDGNEYKASYVLIYSKGDSIRKVEGYNYLV